MNNKVTQLWNSPSVYSPSRERPVGCAGNGGRAGPKLSGSPRYDSAGSDRHFLGHSFRDFSAAALALPANAARVAHAHVFAPVTHGLASVVSGVAGSAVGVAGALVGTVVGILFFSPKTGGLMGFTLGHGLISVAAHTVADLVNLTIDLVLAALAMLLRLVGWSIGAIATAPLMVFGRYES